MAGINRRALLCFVSALPLLIRASRTLERIMPVRAGVARLNSCSCFGCFCAFHRWKKMHPLSFRRGRIRVIRGGGGPNVLFCVRCSDEQGTYNDGDYQNFHDDRRIVRDLLVDAKLILIDDHSTQPTLASIRTRSFRSMPSSYSSSFACSNPASSSKIDKDESFEILPLSNGFCNRVYKVRIPNILPHASNASKDSKDENDGDDDDDDGGMLSPFPPRVEGEREVTPSNIHSNVDTNPEIVVVAKLYSPMAKLRFRDADAFLGMGDVVASELGVGPKLIHRSADGLVMRYVRGEVLTNNNIHGVGTTRAQRTQQRRRRGRQRRLGWTDQDDENGKDDGGGEGQKGKYIFEAKGQGNEGDDDYDYAVEDDKESDSENAINEEELFGSIATQIARLHTRDKAAGGSEQRMPPPVPFSSPLSSSSPSPSPPPEIPNVIWHAVGNMLSYIGDGDGDDDCDGQGKGDGGDNDNDVRLMTKRMATSVPPSVRALGWDGRTLRDEVDRMKSTLDGLGLPIVFGHNDLKPANIILPESMRRRRRRQRRQGKVSGRYEPSSLSLSSSDGSSVVPGVTLIDFELTGYAHRGYDICKLFRTMDKTDTTDRKRKMFASAYLDALATIRRAGIRGGGEEEEEGEVVSSSRLEGEEDVKHHDVKDILLEADLFEPMTWLEAGIFFLFAAKGDPRQLPRWEKLATDRLQNYASSKAKFQYNVSKWRRRRQEESLSFMDSDGK